MINVRKIISDKLICIELLFIPLISASLGLKWDKRCQHCFLKVAMSQKR